MTGAALLWLVVALHVLAAGWLLLLAAGLLGDGGRRRELAAVFALAASNAATALAWAWLL